MAKYHATPSHSHPHYKNTRLIGNQENEKEKNTHKETFTKLFNFRSHNL